jgi:hypothetical protein
VVAVAVHEALDRPSALNENQAQVKTLRCFGRSIISEAAESLGIARVTMERGWRLARARLRDRIREEDE